MSKISRNASVVELGAVDNSTFASGSFFLAAAAAGGSLRYGAGNNEFDALCDRRSAAFVSNLALSAATAAKNHSKEDGATAFIDISGYSKAAATLASQPGGAYVLSAVVHSFLSPILDFVQRNGGDIVKFAGDAIIAVWSNQSVRRQKHHRGSDSSSGGVKEERRKSSTAAVGAIDDASTQRSSRLGALHLLGAKHAASEGAARSSSSDDDDDEEDYIDDADPRTWSNQRTARLRRLFAMALKCAVDIQASPFATMRTTTSVAQRLGDNVVVDDDVADTQNNNSSPTGGDDQHGSSPAAADDGKEIAFSLHIAVSVGRIESSIFSHPCTSMQYRYHFVRGKPLHDVAQLVNEVRAGEVGVSALHASAFFSAAADLDIVFSLPDATATSESDLKYKAKSNGGATILCRISTAPKSGSAAAGGEAPPGTNAPSNNTAAAVTNTSNGATPQPNGAVKIGDGGQIAATPTSTHAAAADFIPPTVVAKLRAGFDPMNFAEMRLLTVLFIHMSDPGTDGHLVDAWFRELKAVLDAMQCPVVQIIDDDKGIHVIAAMDLYVVTRRSTQYAVEVAYALREKKLRTTVGMACGTVFCGVVGTASACRWDITGPAVVRACRLMQHAASIGVDCVVDDSVFLAAGADRSVLRESPRPINVKGTPEPVTVFTLTDHGAHVLRHPLLSSMTNVTRLCETVYEEEVTVIARHANSFPVSVALVDGDLGCGKATIGHRALSKCMDTVVSWIVTTRNNTVESFLHVLGSFFEHDIDDEVSTRARDINVAVSAQRQVDAQRAFFALLRQLVVVRGRKIGFLVRGAHLLDDTALALFDKLSAIFNNALQYREAKAQRQMRRQRADTSTTPPTSALKASPMLGPDRSGFDARSASKRDDLPNASFFNALRPSVADTVVGRCAFVLTAHPLTGYPSAEALRLTLHCSCFHVGALSVSDANTLTAYRLGWDGSRPLLKASRDRTGGSAFAVDQYIAMIQRQRPYITKLTTEGVVLILPGDEHRIRLMPWPVVSPTVALMSMSRFDVLPSKEQRVCKLIATATTLAHPSLRCRVGWLRAVLRRATNVASGSKNAAQGDGALASSTNHREDELDPLLSTLSRHGVITVHVQPWSYWGLSVDPVIVRDWPPTSDNDNNNPADATSHVMPSDEVSALLSADESAVMESLTTGAHKQQPQRDSAAGSYQPFNDDWYVQFAQPALGDVVVGTMPPSHLRLFSKMLAKEATNSTLAASARNATETPFAAAASTDMDVGSAAGFWTIVLKGTFDCFFSFASACYALAGGDVLRCRRNLHAAHDAIASMIAADDGGAASVAKTVSPIRSVAADRRRQWLAAIFEAVKSANVEGAEQAQPPPKPPGDSNIGAKHHGQPKKEPSKTGESVVVVAAKPPSPPPLQLLSLDVVMVKNYLPDVALGLIGAPMCVLTWNVKEYAVAIGRGVAPSAAILSLLKDSIDQLRCMFARMDALLAAAATDGARLLLPPPPPGDQVITQRGKAPPPLDSSDKSTTESLTQERLLQAMHGNATITPELLSQATDAAANAALWAGESQIFDDVLSGRCATTVDECAALCRRLLAYTRPGGALARRAAALRAFSSLVDVAWLQRRFAVPSAGAFGDDATTANNNPKSSQQPTDRSPLVPTHRASDGALAAAPRELRMQRGLLKALACLSGAPSPPRPAPVDVTADANTTNNRSAPAVDAAAVEAERCSRVIEGAMMLYANGFAPAHPKLCLDTVIASCLRQPTSGVDVSAFRAFIVGHLLF